MDQNTKFDETITPGQKIILKTTFPAGYVVTAHLMALGGPQIRSDTANPDAAGAITIQLPEKLDTSRYYLILT